MHESKAPMHFNMYSGQPQLLDCFFELLTGLEHRNGGGGNLDCLTGLRIETCSCCAGLALKGAEANKLNLLTGGNSGDDRIESAVDNGSGFLLGDTDFFCNLINQILFFHFVSPFNLFAGVYAALIIAYT